jgi:hypothetical protein
MKREAPSIWWWAFGYFATYAPYAALTKLVTDVGIGGKKLGGVELLPLSVTATVLTAITFLVATGWWRYAVKPSGLPLPTFATALSGLCASGIIATTTLAYTFQGVSIVFVMLLMRGGLLILAPVIDALGGRKIRWYSGAALVLSIASLTTSVLGGGGWRISNACTIDVVIYLACYFVRLQIMTRRAKSAEPNANVRYFVEEQLVSSPALLLGLVIWAFVGPGHFASQLHTGFTQIWDSSLLVWVVLIGVFSQGTGIFGGLILLDKSENTFSIPVNRASSVLAGIVSSLAIWAFWGAHAPKGTDLAGAGIMIAAILILSLGPIVERRNRVASAG